MGGVISDDVTSTWSIWTLIVLCVTGKNDILMLSPFLPYWPYWSIMANNSAANKGYQIQTFCFEVLIRNTSTLLAFVVATNLFMTMPRGRLWCWACSMRQFWMVICWFNLSLSKLNYQWHKQGFSLSQLWPVLWLQFFSLNLHWSFVDRSSVFRDLVGLIFWGHTSRFCSQCLVLIYIRIVKEAQLGK